MEIYKDKLQKLDQHILDEGQTIIRTFEIEKGIELLEVVFMPRIQEFW